MTRQDRRGLRSEVGVGTYFVVSTGRNILLWRHRNILFPLAGQRTKLLDVTEGVGKSYYLSAKAEGHRMPFQFSVG